MSQVLTKTQIIKKLADKANLSNADVKKVLEAIDSLAISELKSKHEFRVCNLGKLKLVSRKARKMKNNFTGAIITVPAKKVVKFRVAKVVKDQVK